MRERNNKKGPKIKKEEKQEDVFLSWDDFGGASKDLGGQIKSSGYVPNIILGITRGGLFLAGTLGYELSIKNIFVMNVEYYTGKNRKLKVPVVLPPYLELTDIENPKILIVDDVADSGHTIELVKKYCEGRVDEARSVVLFRKPTSVADPDFVWKDVGGWIHFPWSAE